MINYLFALLLSSPVSSLYVPGDAPVEYHFGDAVEISVVKMASTKTQLPYEYYSLPFCPPQHIAYKTENLGEILAGDRIVNTPYKPQVNIDQPCTVTCLIMMDKERAENFIQRINEDYYIYLLADNLPSSVELRMKLGDEVLTQYELGFKVGGTTSEGYFINNHLSFTIRYAKDDEQDTYRIVGFLAEPRSVDSNQIREMEGRQCALSTSDASKQMITMNTTGVNFSYDVTWQRSSIHWSSRWDMYLASERSVSIHWFSILNSVIVIVFLTTLLMVMIRNIRKDIKLYEQNDDETDSLKSPVKGRGWQLVAGDVFRPPKQVMLLVSLVGTGIQLFAAIVMTLIFASFGLLSPANRGSFVSSLLFSFVLMGIFGGYFAGRLYKSLKGQLWKRAAVQTALLYPGICMLLGFLLNFYIWGKHSSAAIPCTTMIILVAILVGVVLPLVLVGFYYGYGKQPFVEPVATNPGARPIPPQKFKNNAVICTLFAGVLPFSAVFIEIFFIFTAIWHYQFYYLFGFVFVSFMVSMAACCIVAAILVHFQIGSEDYHWWWRSFFTSGSLGLYVFLYCIYFFFQQMSVTGLLPVILYFVYSFIIAFTFWILSGTVGFLSAFVFIRRMYASLPTQSSTAYSVM